jgi:1-deoxy-D-xylulose 5-phosphate reductoisomerase
MRSVISYAMSYPDRITSGVEPLDLTSNPPLEFYAPDLDKFTCLRQAFDALIYAYFLMIVHAVSRAILSLAITASNEGTSVCWTASSRGKSTLIGI